MKLLKRNITSRLFFLGRRYGGKRVRTKLGLFLLLLVSITTIFFLRSAVTGPFFYYEDVSEINTPLAVNPQQQQRLQQQTHQQIEPETKPEPDIMFYPGNSWTDTDGKPINAHGGGILHHNGIYYWYGESKSGPTYKSGPKRTIRIDLTGISCYSSVNLMDWKYEANVLPAVSDDPTHDLHPSKVIERPKVVYNARTKKFVLWMHVDSADYSMASLGVAVSDTPTGTFDYLRSFRPNAHRLPIGTSQNNAETTKTMPSVVSNLETGQESRDFTIYVDDDAKAYLFSSSEINKSMHLSELTDDYLDTTGRWQRIFVDRHMEAPAIFKRNGTYYFIASGCTGWRPNAARLAVSTTSIWGPWVEKDNPAIGKDAQTTFMSQSTYVLRVPGKGNDSNKHAFIFLADRWNTKSLENSLYVWLPISFHDETGDPSLQWRRAWSLDDLEYQ